MTMSLAERAASYLQAFPQCADAVWVAGGGRWLYGVWQIGQCYTNASRYYGAYPHGFLKRVMALFPDVPAVDGNPECQRFDPACISGDGECHDACDWPDWTVLHVFSGSLPPGPYARLDSSLTALANVYPKAMTRAELGEAANLSDRSGTFDTYLSRLRTLELIDGKGELRASEELF